jgi:cation:H+ antiporter
MILLLFIAGLVVLTLGAEFLVRGASRLALLLGISPLVVGVTIVALGTGAPELTVSVQSAWSGETDLALGNIVGSNIANLLLILGIAAVVAPVPIAGALARWDIPVMVVVSALVCGFALTGHLGRVAGAVLFLAGLAYIARTVVRGRQRPQALVLDIESPPHPGPRWRAFAWDATRIALGLVGLVQGADWLIESAVIVAGRMGIDERVVGLTVVAVGTSLPELATTVVAALRGERDIAVGNAVGSNTVNMVASLALTALVSPVGVPVSRQIMVLDVPVMALATVLVLLAAQGHRTIGRIDGLFFLSVYGSYLTYLALDSQGHSQAAAWLLGVLIVTSAILIVRLIWRWRRSSASTPATE